MVVANAVRNFLSPTSSLPGCWDFFLLYWLVRCLRVRGAADNMPTVLGIRVIEKVGRVGVAGTDAEHVFEPLRGTMGLSQAKECLCYCDWSSTLPVVPGAGCGFHSLSQCFFCPLSGEYSEDYR